MPYKSEKHIDNHYLVELHLLLVNYTQTEVGFILLLKIGVHLQHGVESFFSVLE